MEWRKTEALSNRLGIKTLFSSLPAAIERHPVRALASATDVRGAASAGGLPLSTEACIIFSSLIDRRSSDGSCGASSALSAYSLLPGTAPLTKCTQVTTRGPYIAAPLASSVQMVPSHLSR